MAIGLIVPKTVAQNLATLAAALDAQPNTSASVVVPSAGNVDVGRAHVKLTATGSGDITSAISAVTNCELMPGTVIV